jgi:hypothetical protein
LPSSVRARERFPALPAHWRIPTLEGRMPMSDGAGARSRSSCPGQQRRSPTASCHSNPIGVIAGSGYIARELSLFPSRFAQGDPHHKWDQEFESAFLQRGVECEPDFLDQVWRRRTERRGGPGPQRARPQARLPAGCRRAGGRSPRSSPSGAGPAQNAALPLAPTL